MPGFGSLFTRARHGGADGTKFKRVGWRLVASCGMLLGVAAAVVAPASAASAGVPTQFWVSQTGLPTGADRSCPTAAYATVQSAVLAAEAAETLSPRAVPTIEICPGTYSEQVTILKSLVLTRAPVAAGLGPVTIQLPAAVGSNQALGLSTTNCQADDAAHSIADPAVGDRDLLRATGRRQHHRRRRLDQRHHRRGQLADHGVLRQPVRHPGGRRGAPCRSPTPPSSRSAPTR